AFDSLRRQLEGPGQDKRDRKTNYNQEYDQADAPTRNFKEGKDLRRYLNQQPADNDVGDGNLVNVAPLQLGEEVVDLHCELIAPLNSRAGTIFSASASKRGSPCSGVRSGSMRI